MRPSFILSKAIGKFAARSTMMQFDLLKLPIELVIHIVEFVDSRKALSRLACTSKQMQDIAEPLLYRHIILKDATRIKAVENAVKCQPKRATAVQCLEVPSHASIGLHIARLERLLMQMHGLRSILFESPFVNAVNFESETVWMIMSNSFFRPFCHAVVPDAPSPRPLQKLTSLTLHLNGPLSPYWNLDDRSFSIFQHPTLESVHVSCMNLVRKDHFITEEIFFTPLRHLILEECNIGIAALAALLKLPKALESLELGNAFRRYEAVECALMAAGENCYNFHHFPGSSIADNANLLFWTHPDATMAALKQQAHSLKSIVYSQNEQYASSVHGSHLFPRMRNASFSDDGFEHFPLLEKVHMKGYSPNFQRAVLNCNSPPNLQEIVAQAPDPIFSAEGWDVASGSVVEQVAKHMPYLNVKYPDIPESLKRITLIYDEYGGPENEDVEKSIARRQLGEVAKLLKKQFGMSLFVWRKSYARFYPPYLYGEPAPKEELLFDGDTGEFTDLFKKWIGEGNNEGSVGVRLLESNDPDYVPGQFTDGEDDSSDDDGVWPVV